MNRTAKGIFRSSVSADERVKAIRVMDIATLEALIESADYHREVQYSVRGAAESRLRRLRREARIRESRLNFLPRKAA